MDSTGADEKKYRQTEGVTSTTNTSYRSGDSHRRNGDYSFKNDIIGLKNASVGTSLNNGDLVISGRITSRKCSTSNYFDLENAPREIRNSMELLKTSRCKVGDNPGESSMKVFDLLATKFGFQYGSVRNQQEHLAVLLCNCRSKSPNAMDVEIALLHHKVFKNYMKWCNFMKVAPIFPGEANEKEMQIALFFLIWGECANIRFMPECLCFLYHKLAQRLEDDLDCHFAEPPGHFLNQIVKPIYMCIAKMDKWNKNGLRAEHVDVRNYDDINEFFWTPECLLFSELNIAMAFGGREVKTFREKRSLLNPFLGFYRIYFFHLVMFHTLIVLAYAAYRGNPSAIKGFGFFSNFMNSDTEEIRRHSFFSIFTSVAFLSMLKIVVELWMDGWLIFTTGRYALSLFVRFLWHVVFFGLNLSVTLSPLDKIQGRKWIDLALPINVTYLIPVVTAAFGNMFFGNNIRNSLLGNFLRASKIQYVGRETQQPFKTKWKYILFWCIVYCVKFLFNLQLMIVPLIGPSYEIWQISVPQDEVKASLLESNHNVAMLIALWAPVFLVYMYDTQIWFTILQSIVGVYIGCSLKVGQYTRVKEFIKTMKLAPFLFDQKIVSRQARAGAGDFKNVPNDSEAQSRLRFAVVWNECISSFRLSDLLDDREATILQYLMESDGRVQDPVFLYAGKISEAISKATSRSLDKECLEAVSLCFDLCCRIFRSLVGEEDPNVLDVMNMIEDAASQGAISKLFDLNKLQNIHGPLVDFLEAILDLPEPRSSRNNMPHMYHTHDEVVLVVQKTEIVLKGIEDALRDTEAINKCRNSFFAHFSSEMKYQKQQLREFYSNPLLMEISTRAFLLLTLDLEDALPRCTEAQRRISFFLHSLTMDMPTISSISAMHSFSVITPYYNETVMFSLEELNDTVDSNPLFKAVEESGRDLTILKYLATCHPSEWGNFLERIGVSNMENALLKAPIEVRLWASNRGQTLARTVQGIMMYEDAIKMLLWLEIGSDITMEHEQKIQQMNYVGRLKFSYITSCQMYGKQCQSGDTSATDIDFLMLKYPNWRVAYVEEYVDVSSGKTQFDTVLLKSEAGEIVEVYRYVLPGNPIIGEGKPENQNNAIQFSRGQYLQTIDMNQEHYFEETLKMPNFLATADDGDLNRPIAIIGMKEHIFTAKASSLAKFMTLQELVFVSLTQRVLANPLESRMHYGHPDVFDKIFAITNGGVAKASRGVNLSEDIFSGYNVTLRGGRVTNVEFMLCGKGRDVALSQINQFEAKLGNGSAEGSLSREVHRMGASLDFGRLNSVYYGHTGFFINNLLTVVCVFVYAYAKCYQVLNGTLMYYAITKTTTLDNLAHVMNTQFIFQFGMLMTVPLIATLLTEKGVRTAIFRLVELIVTLGPVFFIFETGTKAHFFDLSILQGGSKYRGTGRGFHITREMFINFFKEYGASHFRKAIELMSLMVIFGVYGDFSIGKGAKEDYCLKEANTTDCTNVTIPNSIASLDAYSTLGQEYAVSSFAVWLLAVCWIMAPFLFNTDGLDFAKTKVDVQSWFLWMFQQRHLSNDLSDPQDSWSAWWSEAASERKGLTGMGRFALLLREVRHFFVMYYVFLFNFKLANLGILLAAVLGGALMLWFLGELGKCINLPTKVRAVLYVLGLFSCGIVFSVVYLSTSSSSNLGLVSLIVSFFAALYGLLEYIMAFNFLLGKDLTRWMLVEQLAFFFDFTFGLVIAAPLLIISAVPFASTIQTRMMYNHGFSRALSASGEFAACICALLGLLGGFSYGWLTCLIYSLGFVNSPSDYFQNESFTFYLNKYFSHWDKSNLSVFASLGAICGALLAGLSMSFFGRRVAMLLGSVLTITGTSLIFVNSINMIAIALPLVAAGIAMLSLSVSAYNYDICTTEWKGKGVLAFLVGSSLGYLVESYILMEQNSDILTTFWKSAPLNDWRYQFVYGTAPLVLLLPLIIWIPESPSWACCHRDTKVAEALLIRLRQKHDVSKELQILFQQKEETEFVSSSNLWRLGLIVLLQATYALSTSNSLLYRYHIKSSEFDVEGGWYSSWLVIYGSMTMIGLLIGWFSVDQIRRKTIIKDVLPVVAALAVCVGIVDSVLTNSNRLVEPLLFVLFLMSSLSLHTVTWLSAMEIFPLGCRDFYSSFSFMVYYSIQCVLYKSLPSFQVAHFLFAGLSAFLVFLLFFFCASTKTGAIRLKSEKRKEKVGEEEQAVHATRRSSKSFSGFRSHSMTTRSNSHTAPISSRPLSAVEVDYEKYSTPSACTSKYLPISHHS